MLRDLTMLVVLCGAGGVAALRWTVVGVGPHTVLTLQAKQFLGDLVVDAPAGHVYATLYEPVGTEIQVLDGAGTARGYRFGVTNDWFVPLSVEPGTGRLYAVQPSPDRQSTRVNLLDARQGTPAPRPWSRSPPTSSILGAWRSVGVWLSWGAAATNTAPVHGRGCAPLLAVSWRFGGLWWALARAPC